MSQQSESFRTDAPIIDVPHRKIGPTSWWAVVLAPFVGLTIAMVGHQFFPAAITPNFTIPTIFALAAIAYTRVAQHLNKTGALGFTREGIRKRAWGWVDTHPESVTRFAEYLHDNELFNCEYENLNGDQKNFRELGIQARKKQIREVLKQQPSDTGWVERAYYMMEDGSFEGDSRRNNYTDVTFRRVDDNVVEMVVTINKQF